MNVRADGRTDGCSRTQGSAVCVATIMKREVVSLHLKDNDSDFRPNQENRKKTPTTSERDNGVKLND